MQAIILAAGMGSRLGKYSQDNTKCMLSINGRKLIERALDALDGAGITHCVIVVGYKKENLMRFVGDKYKNIKITYIANDVYNKTNNIYSLWLAREHLEKDDTVLLESDLIFDDGILKTLLEHPDPTLAIVAPYESWMDGTVVQISDDNVITNFIPRKFFDYNEKTSYYKTVNIYKFSKEFLRNSYVPFLSAYTQAMGNNEYYEHVLRVITTLDKNELKALVLKNQKWYEIDDAQDKDIAETIFCDSSEDKVRLTAKRYGGYWRFPQMLDYCYLVNPYFPTKAMMNEMKASFAELLQNYPSGLNVQNLLAAKLFNVDTDCILTGNGAAELIRAVSSTLRGKVGVIYPTFNEYAESIEKHCSVVGFSKNSEDCDMSYDKNDILRWSAQCDTLVLINPDNPSGNYIKYNDVLEIAASFEKDGKTLLLDESFIDFCDAEDNCSLLKQDILEQHKNLIIIKSISKSYGVPGLRLGVLASSNRELIASVRKNIPIWNINSFGEFFLQIIGKYTKDYKAACKLIAAERVRFKGELEKTGFFEVYPSEANYFLCRIIAGAEDVNTRINAPELTRRLLEKHNIFIKDLSGKQGIPDNSFVRIAVRDKPDNDRLIAALISKGRTL
jgi:histidinol-phosphate/aromatic aminotransferase/cobyric acid decarboxylase-like protein/choline kinase